MPDYDVKTKPSTVTSTQPVYTYAFTTPICQKQYRGVEELNKNIASVVYELDRTQESHDYKRSHQGGFYTPGDFLEHSEYPGVSQLKSMVEDSARAYIREVTAKEVPGRVPPKSRFEMWAWAALTREKDYQTPHVHGGSTLSCIYYVQVPKKPEPQGCTDFLTPLDIKEMTFLSNASTTFCRVVPKPGIMVVFPSYLKHIVHPFFGPGERIIIAINIRVINV